MVKSAFFVLALAGSAASASDILPASPLMGDVTKAQFMERAAQRFALQDKNGDGVLSVAEKEANLAKLAGVMQQAGKPVPERMSQLKPSRETTRAQFMARQEALFSRLDKNGDGVIGESERLDIKADVDLAGLLDAAEDVVKPIITRMPLMDRSSIVQGKAGVYNSFLIHAERAQERYGVPAHKILEEVGRRQLVGGQEDMIEDLALTMSKARELQA